MTVVAVAGGTGGLGRAVVETLVALNQFDVRVLSRKINPEFEAEVGATMIEVDYTDVNNLKTALDHNGVHTLICTLNVMETGEPQLNCIRAADLSSCTKRFIPAIFGIPHKPEHMIDCFPNTRFKQQALEELKKTSLEYTIVYNGYFLDYYGIPHIKTYLRESMMVVDIKAHVAAIPGGGDVPVVFTYSFDVAKFVGALLGLDKWPLESYIIGDKVTWNEFLGYAEGACGTKFDVVHDSFEDLKRGKVTALPIHEAAYSIFPKELVEPVFSAFGVWFVEGAYNLTPETTLNELFPEIKAWRVKEFLEWAWKGK